MTEQEFNVYVQLMMHDEEEEAEKFRMKCEAREASAEKAGENDGA